GTVAAHAVLARDVACARRRVGVGIRAGGGRIVGRFRHAVIGGVASGGREQRGSEDAGKERELAHGGLLRASCPGFDPCRYRAATVNARSASPVQRSWLSLLPRRL